MMTSEVLICCSYHNNISHLYISAASGGQWDPADQVLPQWGQDPWLVDTPCSPRQSRRGHPLRRRWARLRKGTSNVSIRNPINLTTPANYRHIVIIVQTAIVTKYIWNDLR